MQSPEGSENELAQVLHLGGVHGSGMMADKLLELKASRVVSSEKHCLALCGGTVYDSEGLRAAGPEAVVKVQ